MVRMKSPSPGSSTLITSAPSSPSNPAQNGAEIRVPASTTLMPARGPAMCSSATSGQGRGSPRTRSPTSVRWISLVPAKIDDAR